MTDEQFDHKDHWQALFDSTYLRWFHLQQKPWTVEIAEVEKDVELTMSGGVKKKAPVMKFVGGDRPLVLNKTNLRSIAAIHGQKPSLWKGKKIVLYPTTTKMYDKETKRMETVGCIRVREAK